MRVSEPSVASRGSLLGAATVVYARPGSQRRSNEVNEPLEKLTCFEHQSSRPLHPLHRCAVAASE